MGGCLVLALFGDGDNGHEPRRRRTKRWAGKKKGRPRCELAFSNFLIRSETLQLRDSYNTIFLFRSPEAITHRLRMRDAQTCLNFS